MRLEMQSVSMYNTAQRVSMYNTVSWKTQSIQSKYTIQSIQNIQTEVRQLYSRSFNSSDVLSETSRATDQPIKVWLHHEVLSIVNVCGSIMYAFKTRCNHMHPLYGAPPVPVRVTQVR